MLFAAVASALALAAEPGMPPANAFVYDPGAPKMDEAAGIVAFSAEQGPILVGIVRAGCAVTLPRATWRFWRDDRALLRGNAGALNLTVEAGETDRTPRAVLDGWAKQIRSQFGEAVDRSEVREGPEGAVLVVATDLARHVKATTGKDSFPGARQIGMFAAKRRGTVTFTVHLSATLGPRDAGPDEAQWRDYLTAGFVPDVEAQSKAGTPAPAR